MLSDAVRSGLLFAFLVGLTLLVEPGEGCRPDQAMLSFVAPDAVKVFYVEECGAIQCWSRWLQVEGRRLGVSRVCQGVQERGGLELVQPPPVIKGP